ITSLMLNYVAALVLDYLIFDSESYWRDTSSPSAKVFPQGKPLPDAASWPVSHVGGLMLPFGLLIGVVLGTGIWLLYTRTRFGFEVQVIGDSPRAATYAGMRTRRKILAVMALSGAVAGLGGASQDGDFRHTLDPRGLIQSGYGYAGIGELLAERSGVLNLGVEGMMLVGAVMGFWAVQRTGSLALAVLVAAMAGGAMALIHAFLTVTLRANQIVSGLALTIFAGAAGLSSYLGNDLNLADQPGRAAFTPFLPHSWRTAKVVGPILVNHSALVFA